MFFQKEVVGKKVVVIFAVFIVMTSVMLAKAGVTALFNDVLWSSIRTYFLCEAVGHVKGKCSRESFEKYLTPFLDALFYIVLASITVVYLMFVINLEETFTRIRKIVLIRPLLQVYHQATAPKGQNHYKQQD